MKDDIFSLLGRINDNLEKIGKGVTRIANYMEGSDEKDNQIEELEEELSNANEKLRNRPRH